MKNKLKIYILIDLSFFWVFVHVIYHIIYVSYETCENNISVINQSNLCDLTKLLKLIPCTCSKILSTGTMSECEENRAISHQYQDRYWFVDALRSCFCWRGYTKANLTSLRAINGTAAGCYTDGFVNTSEKRGQRNIMWSRGRFPWWHTRHRAS